VRETKVSVLLTEASDYLSQACMAKIITRLPYRKKLAFKKCGNFPLLKYLVEKTLEIEKNFFLSFCCQVLYGSYTSFGLIN